MAEPTPPLAPPPVTPPGAGRPLPLIAVCVVNAIFAASELLSRQLPTPPPESGIPPFPWWFRHFLDGHGLALLLGAVGLVLLKRWGFLLTALAYFGLVVGLAVARVPWVCAAAMQFPLFAVLSLQWKYLK